MTKTTMAALEAAVTARIPALLWGPPGVGKTAQVEALAQRLGMGFVPVAVSTRPPEDFSGLPVPGPDGVRQEPMSWLVRALGLAHVRSSGCMVLLDEFSCATPGTQAALLSLVQSRYCGDTVIPRGVAFVAAANPVDQAADGWELPLPTISRWLHLSWPAPTVDEWVDWLITGSTRPDDHVDGVWRDIPGQRARALLSGFLYRSPSSLAPVLAQRERGDSRPYPCPRSWEHACRGTAQVIPATGDLGPHLALVEVIVEGCVGRGAAVELCGWLREADLPDPEELLRAPTSWQVPRGRADRALASLAGVAGALGAQPTQPRYDAAIELCAVAAEAGMAGVAVIGAKGVKNAVKDCGLKYPLAFARLAPVIAAASRLCVEGA